MKLTESILLESFRDLKSALDEQFMIVAGSTTITGQHIFDFKKNYPQVYEQYNNFLTQYDKSKRRLKDIPSIEKNSSKGISEIMKYIVQHPYTKNEYPTMADIGQWMRLVKKNNMDGLFLVLKIFLENIDRYENDPERQKPKMEVVKKNAKYTVYKIFNYMAARKFCTTYGTKWCIGASPGWFERYGEDMGREAFVIVLPTKRIVSVFSGSGGFLITSHNNHHEMSDDGMIRGTIDGLVEDFKEAKLTKYEALDAFKNTMPASMLTRVAKEFDKGWGDQDSKVIFTDGGLVVSFVERGDGLLYTFENRKNKEKITAVYSNSRFAFSLARGGGVKTASPREFVRVLFDIGFDMFDLPSVAQRTYVVPPKGREFLQALQTGLSEATDGAF